ncbi:hypothetical protein BGZ76_006427, partial [Entomortierella beljakovae]
MTYINDARKYFLLLHSYYNEAERNALNDAVRTAFLEGLPLQLRQMIEVAMINSGTTQFTMAQVFKSTEEFGRIFHSSSSTTHGAKALAISGSSAGLSNPDAMEIDNIGTPTMATLLKTINNLSIQLNNLSRNNNSNHSPRLGKLTFAEKQELIAHNGCFRCRKHNANHIAKSVRTSVVDTSLNNSELSNSNKVPHDPQRHVPNHDKRTHIHDALVVPSDQNQKPVALLAPVHVPRSFVTDEPDPLAVPPAPSVPLSKSQLKKWKRNAIRLHQFTVQKAENQLLTFIGAINGHPAKILIDGGAE